MAELKDGDLAVIRGNEEDRAKRFPAVGAREVLARFNDDRCPPAGEDGLDCEPGCCQTWCFFGTEVTARADQVEVVRRVKVVDE